MAENITQRRTSEQDACTSGESSRSEHRESLPQPSSKFVTGRAFDAFPYPPYQIQQDFMESLYDTLSMGGIGLFESPTGK